MSETRFQPGDKVLIGTSRRLDADRAQRMRDVLEKRFPGVEFTLMDDVSAIAVQRPEPSPTDETGAGR